MKKLIALVLTLMLMLNAAAAPAATPVLQSAFPFPPDFFKSVLSIQAGIQGLNFTWEEQPGIVDGLPLHKAFNDSGSISISMIEDGEVLAVEITAFTDDMNMVSDLAREFGNTLGAVTLCVCLMEKGTLDQEFLDSLQSEGARMLAPMILSLAKGDILSENVGTMCGYPACIAIELDEASSCARMSFIILPMGSSFSE